MKIHSAAQLAMFTKAAADKDYADSRGITQELAQQHLDAHKANGSPDLPDRVSKLDIRRANALDITNSRPIYLESMRHD